MMSRQQRLIYLPLLGTILLCLLAGIYLAASKRFSKRGAPARVVKHTVETPADEVLKYWTADKMRDARPARMPVVNALKRVKKQPRRPPGASQDE